MTQIIYTRSLAFFNTKSTKLGTTETAMLLRQSGLLRTEIAKSASRHPAGTNDEPRAIGPWAPKQHDGSVEFVRESEWDKYLWLEERDVLQADKPSNVFRVCFVGESVAAGMFFAPSASPAKVLSSVLNQVTPQGKDCVEVIDMSRNAMRLQLLIEMVDSVAQLDPDVIVIFAGNNFCRDHTVGRPDCAVTPVDYVRIANRTGPTGLIEEFNQQLATATDDAVDTIAQVAQANGSKLIWLIPATCSGWQRLGPPMWLDNGRSRQWHCHFRSARQSLQQEDFRQALEQGRTMRQLDRGTCSTTQRLLASALTGLDKKKEAERHLQREIDVDCAVQRSTFLAPGIQSVVRSAILQGSSRHGFRALDLAKLFSECAKTASPYFVDYCHLSVEGMQVAMTALAEDVLSLANVDAPHDCKPLLPNVTPFEVCRRTEARGLFEAAIYNSHLQHELFAEQARNALKQRLVHALRLWPGLANVMQDYVRMRHGAAVTEVSLSAHRLVSGANSLLDFGILQWIHGVDPQTIEGICQVLEEAGHGGAALLAWYQRHDIRRLADGIDLSEPRYLSNFARDGVVDWDAERGTRRTQPFLRSYWQELPLTFAAEKGLELECRFVSRIPSFGGEERRETLRIRVNDQLVTTAPPPPPGSRPEFIIDGALMENGFNTVLIEWPELPSDESAAIDSVIRRFQTFGRADWFPVFGEVHTFHVQTSNRGASA